MHCAHHSSFAGFEHLRHLNSYIIQHNKSLEVSFDLSSEHLCFFHLRFIWGGADSADQPYPGPPDSSRNACIDRQTDETARPRRKSILLHVFLQRWLNTMFYKSFSRFNKTIALHQNQIDLTIPVMWISFSRKETEGVEWASSGFHRVPDYAGPIWAGNNTFLVNAFNLNAVGRGLVLSHGFQELASPGQDLPHTSKRTNTHTHARAPGWRKDSHRLNHTHEATDTALPPETEEPRLRSYFYSCPISSTTSPTFTVSELLSLTAGS